MVPIEFRAMLAAQPMSRTAKGARLALAVASDLPQQQVALLRRFTGETLLEYLWRPLSRWRASTPMLSRYMSAGSLRPATSPVLPLGSTAAPVRSASALTDDF